MSNTDSTDAPAAAAFPHSTSPKANAPSDTLITHVRAPSGPGPIPDETTNPGAIVGTRKSTRLNSRSPSSRRNKSTSRKSLSPRFPIKISMPDTSPRLDAQADGAPVTPGDQKFEDAQDSTPRPLSTEPNGHLGGTKAEEPFGLATNVDGPSLTKASASDGPNAGASSHSRFNTLDSIQPDPEAGILSHTKSPMKSRERDVSPSKMPDWSISPLKGLSGDLPVFKFPPPPPSSTERSPLQSPSAEPSGTPGGLARKASSSLGWLARATSIRRSAKSPPAPRESRRFGERKNTGASLASISSAAEASLTAIVDAPEGTSVAKPSLKDQFEKLRREEEYPSLDNIQHEQSGDVVRSPLDRHNSAEMIMSPTSPMKEHVDYFQKVRTKSASGLLKSPPTNPQLPPGTAQGMTAGPAEQSAPVDWDLWHSVVYEGPAAVARTSGEQLSQAIASGIPAAIRGVVWQVLAQSKSEELEAIYRKLVARGTDQEKTPQAILRSDSNAELTNGKHEKESLASSASSTHSNVSTPATTATSAMTSPPRSVEGSSADAMAKAEATKTTKDDPAALQKLERVIKRDMGSRTSYSKYVMSAGLQDGLFGVCKAYALFDDSVGYAQGINFVAMPLLFNMSEEEAFTLLVKLMSKYDLRSLFTPEMAGLHLRLYQFERLLEDFEPALYCYLHRRGVSPTLYASQWFLTLFAYRFPLQLVLRIYDLIFSEGLSAILKFGILLMQKNKDTLLEMKDMSQLTTFLKERLFDVYIDKNPSNSSILDSGFFGSASSGADREVYRADGMIRDACAVDITAETLARYTAEWEDQQRTDQARELELQTLRTQTIAYTLRVKDLEERTQKNDSEHVGIASELVRTKVENDELADANEGLKVQVAELQKMVDMQPGEVEARLKDEMDRILLRNAEVQNQNRALEEQMEEMERELVGTKMLHAETQSDHDSLKQRWANMQAMFNEK